MAFVHKNYWLNHQFCWDFAKMFVDILKQLCVRETPQQKSENTPIQGSRVLPQIPQVSYLPLIQLKITKLR